MRLDIRR